MKKIYTFLKSIRNQELQLRKIEFLIKNIYKEKVFSNISQTNPEALLLNGFSVFSQCDEDGIIEKIFEEIFEKSRTFIEIGCGNGLENNTHYLLLKGWRGIWIDGSKRNIESIKKSLSNNVNNKLDVVEQIVTKSNISENVEVSCKKLQLSKDFDLVSVDIDSYDIEIIEELVRFNPRVICAEYNPEFRPPLRMALTEAKALPMGWDESIYHGCSLQSLYDLLSGRGYALVGCNLSGYNAFFVKESELTGKLQKLTAKKAYQPPRPYLINVDKGHKKNFSFLNNF